MPHCHFHGVDCKEEAVLRLQVRSASAVNCQYQCQCCAVPVLVLKVQSASAVDFMSKRADRDPLEVAFDLWSPSALDAKGMCGPVDLALAKSTWLHFSGPLDVALALHACGPATDYAMIQVFALFAMNDESVPQGGVQMLHASKPATDKAMIQVAALSNSSNMHF
eukprot:1158825-Pelagomonas_calceolata.AAC.11